ncbi:MAG: hypothetical protein AMS27_05665 [Bacteroides sp. SM23_62_1]|nr:MAG: hypothetical protein AMS27_05665 [Bacteroides sp. SM23_62_1]
MKTQMNRTQTALIAATAAFLILSGILFYSTRSLKNQLENEKIRSETLLSEKLNLEKSIDKFKKDLTALQGKNAQLDKVVKETSDQLAKKESEIRKLIAENASLNDLKKKNAELEALRKKLEEQVASLNMDMDKLIAENKKFSDQLASMKKENESLTTHNALLEAMLADNYRVEALKGKHDKLTVAAKRTNKLMVSFDVPANLGKDLYFKLVTPDGKELSSKDDNSVTMKFYDENKNLMASLTGTAAGTQNAKRAELIYKPDHKLVKGIYKFNVYNNKEYMGSIQMRLK